MLARLKIAFAEKTRNSQRGFIRAALSRITRSCERDITSRLTPGAGDPEKPIQLFRRRSSAFRRNFLTLPLWRGYLDLEVNKNMENNFACAVFSVAEIRRKFYEYVDMALTPDVRANEQDIVRMAYMARGAKDLADALIDEINKDKADKSEAIDYE